jgi:hypothetical protein
MESGSFQATAALAAGTRDLGEGPGRAESKSRESREAGLQNIWAGGRHKICMQEQRAWMCTTLRSLRGSRGLRDERELGWVKGGEGAPTRADGDTEAKRGWIV